MEHENVFLLEFGLIVPAVLKCLFRHDLCRHNLSTWRKVIHIYSFLLESKIFLMYIQFWHLKFCSNSRNLGFFCKFKKCVIFWEISHQHQRNFSIVCIILSSTHIKSFIYFSLSVPVVLKLMHPQNEQNRSSTSGPLHFNPMDILKNVFTSRIPSRFLLTAVWILLFNPLTYCQN